MNSNIYQIHLDFVTPLLGTQPSKDVASQFIAARYAENGGELPEDEAQTLTDALERGTTVFHKFDGEPILYDYQIKGFLKEAGKVFNGLGGVRALRSKIDNTVFINPRRIRINLPLGSDIIYMERPLRAETMQGPRVSLVRSEMIAEGASIDFQLEILPGQIDISLIDELLQYGRRKGIGQWRNGGFGQFVYQINS